MSEIAVVAISVAKPGYEEQLREALEGIVGPTRNEQGALQYDLHRDVQEPRRFVFVERWESQEALAAHAKIRAHRGLRESRGGLGGTRGNPRGVEDRLSVRERW